MVTQIRPSQLSDWLDSIGERSPGQAATLLDVREPWEVQTASVGDVPGVQVLTIPMNSVPARLAELDPQAPIACLCHHGARSQQVALFLSRQGFTQLANIAGGIDAWSAERDAQVPRY